MSDFNCPDRWEAGVLCDNQIAYLCNSLIASNNMIAPFVDHQVKENKTISYGLSSYGYDVRIANEFKIIPNENFYALNFLEEYLRVSKQAIDNCISVSDIENKIAQHFGYYSIHNGSKAPVIDPTDLDPLLFADFTGSEIIIPPHGFALGKTMEVVNIPRDVTVIALGKSTWNRCGLLVGVTPVEAGFIGTVTIELSNTTDLPIRIKAGHGISQFLFLKGSAPCEVSYADRGGKYQNQVDVTLPRVLD